ncbi:MAG TPA: glycosyl hydrolase [Thermoanaerobaculia bacterium]|nr:glycosyl hydrolase [Thermoanaerobaculia bacterium]
MRKLFSAAILLGVCFGSAVLGDDKPLSKEEERRKFHPHRTGMDAAARSRAIAMREAMEKSSPLSAIRFRSVGPEVQGGRVVDLAAPPARPDSLIVAFASGGLWRTDNRGGSWSSLFDSAPTLTVGAFALGDAEGNTIYVGTGESNSSRTSYAGTGMYKTTDGGKTWQPIGLSDSHHIGRVSVDPRDPQVVLVAAVGHLYTDNPERGVFRTADGGRTWTRALFVDDRTGAIDVVRDPKNPDVVYAATWERARTAANFLESGPGSGVWKSADGGRTWKRLSGGLPSGATVGRIGISVAASRPETVYAVVDNQALRPDSQPPDEEAPPGELTPRRLKSLTPELFAKLDDAAVAQFLQRNDFPKTLKAARLKKDVAAGRITIPELLAYLKDGNRDLFETPIVGLELYRSDDGGATWKRTHDKPIEKVFYAYGYYFARVEVDPADPDRLYIGGVPMISSTDGGRTFKGIDQRGVHGDHHAILIDPKSPRHVVIGNDGGVNVSYDHGETWSKLNNIPVGQFTTLAVDNADPYNIVGGLQDNGVLRGPSNYHAGKTDPQAWRPIYGGDGSCVAIDPKDGNVVYAASQFGSAARLNLKTNERQRITPRAEFSAKKREKPLRYNWISPFIISPHSHDILYFGTNRLYRSFDRGDTWTAISQDLTANREQGDVPFGTITSISESPKRFGVLFAGTDEGKVWGTRDGGATWSDLSAGLAKDKWVTRVVASHFDEGTVYVSQNGYRDDEFSAYLFRSTDYGKTWRSIAAGLPAEPINTVREDPRAKHLLYVGTDAGVFVSLDRGATWTALAGGLPRVAVHDLAVQPREGDLVVATHGRSVYVADAAPLRKLKDGLPSAALTAFPVKKAKIGVRKGYGEHPYFTWPLEEPVVRIAYWEKTSAPARISIVDENGSVWKELDGTSVAGMNVVSYDLSADPKFADSAEAKAREKALAKEKEKEKTPAAAKPPAAAAATAASTAEDDEEDADEAPKPEERTPPAPPKRPLDPELDRLLSDPMRASRKRYLSPGKYTVEIKAAGETQKTPLIVEAERGGFNFDGGGEE